MSHTENKQIDDEDLPKLNESYQEFIQNQNEDIKEQAPIQEDDEVLNESNEIENQNKDLK